MSKVLPIVGVAVVAVAGYFGLSSAGIIGAPAVWSDEEVEAGLAAYAEQINSEDGVRFDDFSRLTSAMHMEKTITIRGESILEMADIGATYYDSRLDQGANVLCNDETLREVLRGRGTVHFNWFSADGEPLGDMITFRGDEACAIHDA